MPKAELTNMVMIQDKNTGKVLVQERIKSWKGLSFPGGHVENGESFIDSAVREIKEETGLNIINLKSCGVIHWTNNDTFERYIVFLYKTTDYSGELLSETDEGKVYWIDIEKLKTIKSANGFERYLTMFLDNTYNEAFGFLNKNEKATITYK